VESAKANWADLDGYAAAHGLSPLQDFPIDRFCNFVWYMFTKEAEQREVDKLRAKLWQPLPGTVVTDPRSPWFSKNESNAFSALKRSMGG